MIKEGHRSNLAHVAAAALAIVFLSFGVVQAQEWPNKPVTMIVPLPAGGATDAALAAIKTPALRQRLNESGYILRAEGAPKMLATVQADLARFRRIAVETGISSDQ